MLCIAHAIVSVAPLDVQALSEAANTEAAASSGRVSETKQFKQLRTMLSKKNGQLTELRKRLAVYEPDTTPLVDEASSSASRK